MKNRLEIKRLSDWGIPYRNKFVISGPCSAESEDQIIETRDQSKRCYVLGKTLVGLSYPRFWGCRALLVSNTLIVPNSAI